MTFRKLLLYSHLIPGLLAALLLMAMGLSGAALVFDTELNRTLNPQLRRVEPGAHRLPLNELFEKLQQSHREAIVTAITLGEVPDDSDRVTLKLAAGGSFELAVDPYTGKELGLTSRANPFMAKLRQFHKNLLLGLPGKLITGWGAIFLVVLSVSGFLLWWPRKIWKFDFRNFTRWHFDLHNALGFYSSVFMLVFALTGLVVHWEAEANKMMNRIAGVDGPPRAPKAPPHPAGVAPLGADQAVAIALGAVPGATVTMIQGLDLAGPIHVVMRYPEDHTPIGRSHVWLNPYSGEVLSVQTSRTATPGAKLIRWNWEIHSGGVYGRPTRILACLASISLPLLAITGPLIWWSRIRRKRAAAAR